MDWMDKRQSINHENFKWIKLSQIELDDVIRRHEGFLKSQVGGERANLKFLNLSYLDFSERNLYGLTLQVPTYEAPSWMIRINVGSLASKPISHI